MTDLWKRLLAVIGIITLATIGYILLDRYVFVVTDVREEKIDNIVRIMDCNKNTYRIYIKNPESQDITPTTINPSHDFIVTFKEDVPLGQSMWLVITYPKYKIGDEVIAEKLEFHVHAAQDIDGGGWNHGKLGSGQVVPLY